MRHFAPCLVLLAACAGPNRQHEVASNKPAIRGSAGAIELVTPEQRSVKLSDYGAPVTVLAIWATWCQPCLDELPLVERLYQQYKGNPDVSILAISIDEVKLLDGVKAKVRELKLTLPVLIDARRQLRERLAISDMVPLLLFIDPNFKMLREVGFNIKAGPDDFIAKKREIIELAKVGRLPEQSSVATSIAPGELPSGHSMKIRFAKAGPLNDERRGRMREQLKRVFPQADEGELDEMMAKVEEAAQSGGEVMLKPPEH